MPKLNIASFATMQNEEENINGLNDRNDDIDYGPGPSSSSNRRSEERSSSNRRNINGRGSEERSSSNRISSGRSPDGRRSPEDYAPPSSSSRRRRSPEEDAKPERKPDRRFVGPYGKEDNDISIRYPSSVKGYFEDSKERDEMKKMGLPTGFDQGRHNMAYNTEETGTVRQRGKKGDKMTYYCEICMIELNSEDTMHSHMAGVKHLKKKLAQDQQRNEEIINGRQVTTAKKIIRIDNPEPTKKKVPIRLHEKIKETMDPVVGLQSVKEYIAVSDAEMEPHYECELCGSQGQANGMFSHIMGHKHRQKFVDQKYGDDNPAYMNLTNNELRDLAAKCNENSGRFSELIRTRRSDEEYPWPAGKAPWSVEKGGTGIPPDNSRENWGKNRLVKSEIDIEEEMAYKEPKHFKRNSRDMSPEMVGRFESSQRSSGLPTPKLLKKPRDSQERLKYAELGMQMLKYAMEQELSTAERDIHESNIETLYHTISKRVEKNGKRPRSVSQTSRSPSTSKRRTISPPSRFMSIKRSDSMSRGRSPEERTFERNYNGRSSSPERRRKRSPPSPSRNGYTNECRNNAYDKNGYDSSRRNGDYY